jgi:hypothetical protein
MEFNDAIKWLKPKKIKNDKLLRVGTRGDGGYILSKSALIDADSLISLGIKDDWNFENEFLKINTKSTLLAIDLVTDFMFFLKCSIAFLIRFNFKKFKSYFLKLFHYVIFFHLKKNVKYLKQGVSGNKQGYLSLNDIIKKIDNSKKKLFLKIDIEGDEYSLLCDFVENKNRILMICIELHNVITNREIFLNFVEKISKHYTVIHLHMNNNSKFDNNFNLSDVIELTIANNDYFDFEQISTTFYGPTALDYPCNPSLDDIIFKL